MATEIGRSLDEIDKKVKGLNKTLRASQDETKALDTALKLDMASIEKGRGTAYIETLDRLGVSTMDAAGKTKGAAEVYSEIVSALGAVADETERASLASILFGDNGLNVSLVAGLTREEIYMYNEELARHGIVSSEAAAQAGAIADRLDDCKQQIQAASAELIDK